MSKMQQWLAGTLVVVLAILVAGWFLAISPKRAQVQDLNTRAAAAQVQAESLKSTVKMLTDQKRGLPTQQAKIARFAKEIPADAQLPTLVRLLTTAAGASGVTLTGIEPGAPVALPSATTTATGTTSAPSSGAALASSLMTVPVQLTVAGDYFQVEQFVSALEGLQRRFLVSSYTLGPPDAGSSGTSMTTGNSSTTSDTANGCSVCGAVQLQLSGNAFELPAAAVSTPTSGTSTAVGSSNGTSN